MSYAPAMAESPMAQPLGALTEPALDKDGRLIDDLACRRCGYSLRGLRPDGQCPECETPVGRSIKGELLRYSDPDWVQRIARGGQLLALSILLFVALPIIALLMAGIMPAMPFGFALAIAKSVQVVGIWLTTSPEPAMHDRETVPSPRMVARWGSIVTGAIWTAGYIARATPASLLLFWIPGATNQLALRVIVDDSIIAITIISNVALLLHARALAFRLWDDKLWRQLTGVAVIFAIAFGAKALLDTYAALTGSKPFAGTDSPLKHIETITHLVTLVTLVWCMNLIFRFRKYLNEAATLARETWARPTGTIKPGPAANTLDA